LLDDETLEPRPDYYASALFKRLMGGTVLHANADTPARHVRAYAHCTAADGGYPPGAVTLLWVHTRDDAETMLRFSEPLGTAFVYEVTANGKTARDVRLNDQTLTPKHIEDLPRLGQERSLDQEFRVPPLSYAFAVLPEAHAEACR
jgi:hypothetical protein